MSLQVTVFRQCPNCKCDLTHRNRYICETCWRALPKALSNGYNQSRTLEERREAYRAILRHFRDNKQQPELPL